MRKVLYILRFISDNKYVFILNFIGITLGLTSTILIIGLVLQEFNYDSYSKNYKNVYRIILNSTGVRNISNPKPLAKALISELPEVQNSFRFYPWYGYLACSSEEKKFTEKRIIFTDESFLEVMDIPLLFGSNKNTLLDKSSVLLSKSAAIKYFNEENPVGKQLKIGYDKYYEIKGVYQDFPKESNFRGDIIFDISIIHHLTQVYFPDGWDHNSEFSTFVHLREHADIAHAIQKIQDLFRLHSEQETPVFELQPLQDIHVNKDIIWESVPQININYLYLLMAVATILLSMSLANFSILYIATAFNRKKGTLVRTVYGATKFNLFVEFQKEVWLILGVSFLCTLLLVKLVESLFSGTSVFLPELSNPFSIGNIKLYMFMFFILLLTGFLPAYLLTSKFHYKSLIAKTSVKSKNVGFMNILIVIQFALCTFLIMSNMVIHNQLSFLTSFDPGYKKDELLTIPLNMHIGEGIYNERIDVFCNEMTSHTGVNNITLGFSSPASVLTSRDEATWEGMKESDNVKFCWNSVYYDYFETLGVKVIEGRGFIPKFKNDFDHDNSFSNYILNQTAIREMGIEDPIGKTFNQYGFEGKIVGIVEDFHFRTLHEEIFPMVFNMNPFYFNEIIVRINPNDKQALAHIEETWNKFIPDHALEMSGVTDQLNKNYQSEQQLAVLLNTFILITIIIAILGLTTLTITSTQKRIKEIGIRKVNGASVFQILVMLNRDFIKWVMIGFIIISPIASYFIRLWLNNFAFKIELSVWIFILSGATVFLIGIITVSSQSVWAAFRDPVKTLRYE